MFFELKWLIYVEKLSPFSLFALYASDNLIHFQLETFHARYANHKNYKDSLLTLYEVYRPSH